MRVTDARMFCYEGEIRGQGRPRATKRGNHASVYKALKDRQYEAELRAAYLEDWEGMDTITGAFKLEICAVYKVPDSWSRKKRREMLGRYCTKKPDIDNIIKSVLDALQRNEKAGFAGAFENDKDCAVVAVEKRWGLSDRVMVTISKLEYETEEEQKHEDQSDD